MLVLWKWGQRYTTIVSHEKLTYKIIQPEVSYEPENTSDTEEPDVDTMKKTFNRLAVQDQPSRPPDNNHGPSRAQQEAEQRRL